MKFYKLSKKVFTDKRLRVYSHPRSGTHFLEAFIAKNFYKNVDLSIQEVKWGHWSNRKINKSGNPYGQLFGHHFFPTNNNFKAPGVYIIRDGRAVAFSVWNTHNFLHKDIEGKISFSKFLRTPLDWFGSPSKKTQLNMNIFEHWEKHCSDWLKFSESQKGLLIIYYEDLKNNPFWVYKQIKKFNFRYKTKISLKELIKIDKPTGLLPNMANNNSWVEHFERKDHVFFESILKNDLLISKYGKYF